jgi:hypothetical protein
MGAVRRVTVTHRTREYVQWLKTNIFPLKTLQVFSQIFLLGLRETDRFSQFSPRNGRLYGGR